MTVLSTKKLFFVDKRTPLLKLVASRPKSLISKPEEFSIKFIGGCRGIRTPNLMIWNHSLYRWSYTPGMIKNKKKAHRVYKPGGPKEAILSNNI